MVSQNAIPSRKHLGGSLPYVFTEQGVASLSGVLKSPKAAEVHVQVMRAFVEMRRFIQNNAQVFARLESVERRQISFESETGKPSGCPPVGAEFTALDAFRSAV